MKKKNVLMMALSLALVAVIAVGGTLAYLTADTGTLTNTFNFTTNGINLVLKETAKVADGSSYKGYTIENLVEGASSTEVTAESSNDKGIVYDDVVPGAQISKEPQLKVASGAVDCYVYAYVTGIDTAQPVGNATTPAMWTQWNATKWEVVNEEAGMQLDGVLLKYKDVVTTADQNQFLEPIFTTVSVNDNLTEGANLGGIVIQGYAIQSSVNDEDNTAGDKAANAYFFAAENPED